MAKLAEAVEEEKDAGATPAAAKAGNPWIPVIAVIVLMPLISYGMTFFILIPGIKSAQSEKAVTKATARAEKTAAAPAHGAATAKGKDEIPGKETYAFDNIVVNLAGAKGTRYLKTSFTLVSSNPNLKEIIAKHRIELLDLTLNILAGKTLVDLEAPGAYNMLRHDLIENYNQVLNSTVVEQIYFTEHVIQ